PSRPASQSSSASSPRTRSSRRSTARAAREATRDGTRRSRRSRWRISLRRWDLRVASRRLAREHALPILFQIDLTGDDPATALDLHWRGRDVDETTRAFAERVVRGAIADAVRIDVLIREASENWRLERMATVDRNVLRVAIYELLHESETPPAVVID